MWQIFMERYSKGEFHVLVKELKLFDHESFFKHIVNRPFIFHSDASHTLFCLIICCIQQVHWPITLQNNLFRFGIEFSSTPKRKKCSSTRKRNDCVFSRCACAKLTFSCPRKHLNKWTPAFIVRREKIANLYE